MSFTDQIAKSFKLRARGILSDADLALEHQHMAREMFPQARNVGEVLAKFYDTDIGQHALKVATSTKYFEFQKDHSVGNGYEHVQKHMNREEPYNKDAHDDRREHGASDRRMKWELWVILV